MRLPILPILLLAAGCASAPTRPAANWWKGNLHTHSLWSDGADYPEMIGDWYKAQGYHFLGITEHDMLQQGERWVDINAPDDGWPPRNTSARRALPGYRARFGDWVQERHDGSRHLVRLRGLDDYRAMFEEPGRFVFLMGEEITDRKGTHLNAFNLERAVLPRGGETAHDRIRNNLEAIAEQQQAQAAPIAAILNHPNFTWALTADAITNNPAARLFEVYNGHKMTNSAGDADHPGTERIWDEVLTARHKAGAPPLFGVATDDAHDYREYGDTISRPGRGWVMVRAARLEPNAIVRALQAGDFYASTGVTLRDVAFHDNTLRIEIAAQPGVTYHTMFIGTRGNGAAGETLAEAAGGTIEYRFKGDERYVRARIVSSRPQRDAIGGAVLGFETAWTQPVYPNQPSRRQQ